MPKGQLSKFFPGKLLIMLDQVDGRGLSHGSSWVSEGRAFAIHDPDVFMHEIAPQFFDKQTHLRSFHRQLSIWGFTRLETGAGGRGVWFHKHFIRDKPELIKHIKRVPVKNPKPTLSTPKNQLPDYTNYQLPVSCQESSHAAKASHASMHNPSPVHKPRHNIDTPSVGACPPESTSVSIPLVGPPPPPPEGLGYLSALGRMPHAVPPRYPAVRNSELPMPVRSVPPIVSDPARRYPSFVVTNYHPPAVTSMSRLPTLSAGNTSVSSANELGEVAHQLLACRSNAPDPNSLGDGGNNLNSAILAMIMDSRPRGTSTSNAEAGLSGQELLSALVRRNLFQGPK